MTGSIRFYTSMITVGITLVGVIFCPESQVEINSYEANSGGERR